MERKSLYIVILVSLHKTVAAVLNAVLGDLSCTRVGWMPFLWWWSITRWPLRHGSMHNLMLAVTSRILISLGSAEWTKPPKDSFESASRNAGSWQLLPDIESINNEANPTTVLGIRCFSSRRINPYFLPSSKWKYFKKNFRSLYRILIFTHALAERKDTKLIILKV